MTERYYYVVVSVYGMAGRKQLQELVIYETEILPAIRHTMSFTKTLLTSTGWREQPGSVALYEKLVKDQDVAMATSVLIGRAKWTPSSTTPWWEPEVKR